MRRFKLRRVRGIWLILIIACALTAGSLPLQAQIGTEGIPVALNGKITVIKGQEMTILANGCQRSFQSEPFSVVKSEPPCHS